MFRVSHRKEYPTPPQGDPRARSNLPGEPFHSFREKDAQETPVGAAVLCRFQMMPTAYCFAKVCALPRYAQPLIMVRVASPDELVCFDKTLHCLLLCLALLNCA